MQAQIVRHQFRLSLRPGRSHRSLIELRRVVAAVVGRDPAEAESAARDHILAVLEELGAESADPLF